MFKKILVPVDGSDFAYLAAQRAVFMAAKQGGMVTLLHVINHSRDSRGINLRPAPKNEQIDQLEIEGLALLEKVRANLELIRAAEHDDNIIIESELAWGNPAEVIVEKAKSGGYNLIVMGSRGLGALSSLLLGSVSERVVKMAPCQVLIVRGE
jgi:nucleotide-binding universal stress UspA family protein